MKYVYCMMLLLTGVCAIIARQFYPQDSLTSALCKNEEQIVSKRINEWRIQYYMGETELNMKTMKGFLSLNSSSKPIYNHYRLQKTGGWLLFFSGIGLIIADGKIKGPEFPVIPLGGIALSVGGIVIWYKSNHTFRLAIQAYNRDICKIR